LILIGKTNLHKNNADGDLYADMPLLPYKSALARPLLCCYPAKAAEPPILFSFPGSHASAHIVWIRLCASPGSATQAVDLYGLIFDAQFEGSGAARRCA
jgi:hypothetical protein